MFLFQSVPKQTPAKKTIAVLTFVNRLVNFVKTPRIATIPWRNFAYNYIQLRGRPFDFWGRGGGERGWFGLGKNFFSIPFEIEFFPTSERCTIFFSLLYAMRGFFFSAGYLFPKYFLARFFPSKSVVVYFFFLKSPIPLLQSQMVTPWYYSWQDLRSANTEYGIQFRNLLKTLQVRILTNINFLPTIFICCQEKWLLELKKNDHLGENALICYQILSRLLSTSSLRKCMEISLENL